MFNSSITKYTMDKKKLSQALNVLDRIDREIGGLAELLLRDKIQRVPVPVKVHRKPIFKK